MEIEPLEGKAAQATQVPEGCTLVMFDGAVRSSKTISSLMMWLRFLRRGPAGARGGPRLESGGEAAMTGRARDEGER